MKRFYKVTLPLLLVLTMCIGLACVTYADSIAQWYVQQVYSSAGTGSTLTYGTPFRVDINTKKTIQFYGYTSSTTAIKTPGQAGSAMSGTAALYACNSGVAATALCVPAKDNAGTTISTTSNLAYNLDDNNVWYVVGWTPGAGSQKKLIATVVYSAVNIKQ